MMNYESLTALIIEFYEKISAWEQEKVRDAALTVPQMHILEILGHHSDPRDPMRMTDVAGKMGVTSGTLTVGIDRLEKQGLVQRSSHPVDRRSVVVVLTDAGQRMFAEHHQHHLALTEALCAQLSPEEQVSLERVLRCFNEMSLPGA